MAVMGARRLSVLVLVLAGGAMVSADPPEPMEGYRWVINPDYSDEFNGDSLDRTKWNNYFTMGWKGRKPAFFEPSAVSVGGGNMMIDNAVLGNDSAAPAGYTIAGGAVSSVAQTAHFGYYEANFKSSRITMSTTFWMSNPKVPVNFVTKKSNETDCPKDRYSQELDIAESVGGEFPKTWAAKFRTKMNFNTHYRYIDCEGGPETFYSAGNNAVEGNGVAANADLTTESWEAFHTYAAHWKNANEVSFYSDDRYIGDVKVNTEVVDKPFDRPMGINMVTETYNWARPVPTPEELADPAISISYYNWVRSHRLVEVDEDVAAVDYPGIYESSLKWFAAPELVNGGRAVRVSFVYKANKDVTLRVYAGETAAEPIGLLRGYGKAVRVIALGSPSPLPPSSAREYYAELRDGKTVVASVGTEPCITETEPAPAPTTPTPTPTATLTPTPTPTPEPTATAIPATPEPQPECKAEKVWLWDNCHGKEGCCSAGSTCVRQSEWYSQCRPLSSPQKPQPGCSKVVWLWGNCLGSERCCAEGSTCVRQSEFYAQCRPLPSPYKPKPECKQVVWLWGNCHDNKDCCAAGSTCVPQSKWYSQCRLMKSPQDPKPGCEKPVLLWGNCHSAENCCTEGSTCVRQSKWYSQCRPITPPVLRAGCKSMVWWWGNCLDNKDCCAAGSTCVQKDKWYAQCIPLSQ